MNKKHMAMARLMTSLVTAVILCFCIAMPAFAAEGPFSSGDKDKSAEAKITKMLKIAEGTEIPDKTFEFEFTANEVEDLSVPEEDMPAITDAMVSFTWSDMSKALDAVNGVVYVPKETEDDIFEGVVWPHAGVYVYTVKEIEKSDTEIDYSAAKYDVYVYVANVEDGDGLFVDTISARIAENDESNSGSDKGTKVNPAPGGGDNTYSRMIYTNTYTKSIAETDPKYPTNHKLNINKTVEGAYGDRTKYFAFEVDIQKPATVLNEMTYRAYVVEKNGDEFKVVTSTENFGQVMAADEQNGFGDYINITTGTTPITVNLRHGQQLVFTAIHDGASYFVNEKAAEDYTASVVIIQNGDYPGLRLANSDPNEDRSTAPDNESKFWRIVNGTGNEAAFSNMYKEVTPMGISVDNLPYIMMIAIAVIALVGYAAFKYRRNPKAGK